MHPSRGGAELQGVEARQASPQESEEILLPRKPLSQKGNPPAEAENRQDEHLGIQTMPQGWPDVFSRLLGPQ